MEKGLLICHFKGNKRPLFQFLMSQWPSLLVVGLFGFTLVDDFVNDVHISSDTWVLSTVAILLAISLSTVTYKNMSELKLTAYENGIDVPNVGFFTWQMLAVRRLAYVQKSATVGFMPCFYIDIKDKKTIAIYQHLEQYTGLYHLLHNKGVKGASNKLLIYDTLPDGRHTGWKQEYIAIFDPIKNELLEEKGDPLKSPYNI